MLVITRYVGETLKIGDDVDITILGVNGNQVRVGANAPEDVSLHRQEIYERIQLEKEQEAKQDRMSKPTVAWLL